VTSCMLVIQLLPSCLTGGGIWCRFSESLPVRDSAQSVYLQIVSFNDASLIPDALLLTLISSSLNCSIHFMSQVLPSFC
jgi:hypothetical protein